MTAPAVDLEVAVRRGEVERLLGYRSGRRPPVRIAPLIDEAVDEARSLVRARGAWVRVPVGRAAEVGLPPVEAGGLVLGLVTAGPAVEARVTDLLGSGEATRAVILDAAGSAAAEEAADRLGAAAVGEPDGGEALDVPCRLSPGYGGWPIEAQRALFRLLPHEAVGVALLDSLLMVPRKSVSFAMWLGAGGRVAPERPGCARCTLAGCRYRRREA